MAAVRANLRTGAATAWSVRHDQRLWIRSRSEWTAWHSRQRARGQIDQKRGDIIGRRIAVCHVGKFSARINDHNYRKRIGRERAPWNGIQRARFSIDRKG